MEGGYVANDHATVALSSAYSLAVIIDDGALALAIDPKARTFPTSGYFADVEIELGSIVTAATIRGYLTWDAAGLHPIAGQSDIVTFYVTVADATKGGCAISLDKSYNLPTGATVASRVYLWLKLDAGTANCVGARLGWRDSRG